MSILIREKDKKLIKGVLCNNDQDPLLWADQKTAFDFWLNFKKIFQIDFTKNIRATPQVVREGSVDDILFTKIENNKLIPILPVDGIILYSDSWEHPCEILGPDNLRKLWEKTLKRN